jgi:Galactose oxidase, central domain
MHTMMLCLVGALSTDIAAQNIGPANTWTRLDRAAISGRRWDVPLGYAPGLKRFIILGGRSSYADYRKPRSYDVLTLYPADKTWENDFPLGKDWGPTVGACTAPAWKGEVWSLRDIEGTVRPNWTVYGTFSLGQKYDHDPDTKAFYFYAGGNTFKYEPTERRWTNLNPPTHPEKALGGTMLWSSMVYDRHNEQFVLFGGGNVQSERGDPGTWTYSPAKNTWTPLNLNKQPSPRANSRLAYDPVAKKIVLFGGDQLDQLKSDTWLFDVVKQEWIEVSPAVAPSPRGGHALLWLAKAKKILLVGGYTYTSTTEYVAPLYQRLPIELWTYDVATNRWQFLSRTNPKEGPDLPANTFCSAAVDADDNVLLLGQTGAWMCRVDATKADAAGAAKYGGRPGAVQRRSGSHDPQWYAEEVAPGDPVKVEAELRNLLANEWKVRPTPKRPLMNMDWGSAVLAPEHDLIVRFSGGHSAYSGTAPVVYDVKTDRYSIPFAPEYPLEYVYSNDQVRGEWSFKRNPWMTGHTYKSTGYDPQLREFIFAPHDYTYFFDPKNSKWSRGPQRNPYQPSFYLVTVCATPTGAIVWANHRQGGTPGLWRLDASRRWQPLPLKGALPQTSADHHGMAYDSRRDRLLLFSDVGKNKGDVLEYDFKTGATRWLDAAGKDKALSPCRETIYVPEADAVLIGAHHSGGSLWLMYDCGINAWVGVAMKGADPIGKKTFNNSMGLMYDPQRHLVWAVGQYSHLHVLRLDAKTAMRKITE